MLHRHVRRDAVIWAAILASHGLLLAIVLRIENQSQRSSTDAAAARSYIWLSLAPITNMSIDKQPVPVARKPLRRTQEVKSPLQVQPVIAPKATPRIDWSREGAISAAAVARTAAAAASKPGTFSPPANELRKPCQPRKSSVKWQPPRVGMAGADGGLHLPYVMLGKRCVLGLGFFGCDLGKLPEPNSHLLDDMHDPDLSRSAEPAVDSCE